MPLPTRRAARADLPTAWGGEIGADSPPGALRAPTPHPASSLRELADLPAWRGGEIAYPPGADLPTAWGGEIGADSPPGADLPTAWGGEIGADSPPGELASRAGRPPRVAGRRDS